MTTISPPALQQQLDEARSQTDRLFDLLQPGVLYERPVQERHRLVFYLGHFEAFDWNQVCRYGLGMASFSPYFDKLFEAGIDPEPGKAPHDQISDWPSAAEVRDYLLKTRRRVDDALADAPEQLRHLAVEHRLMHAETFAYLMHNLPFEKKIVPSDLSYASSGPSPENPFLAIPAGKATLGQDRDRFGWDNEFEQHSVEVPAFRVSKYKVTNGEYLRFVESGAPAPNFWLLKDGQWFYRGMFGLVELPLDWPVWLTKNEADAYAQAMGKSLMTEAQFHRAAEGVDENEPGNANFRHWDPVPVTAYPGGDSQFGVSQLNGNGWEWTSTPFAPFAGFRPFPFYPGYSANFFDNAHFVIKGGSPRTAACFLRKSFRNWFRPNYPYVYAGFRLVEN